MVVVIKTRSTFAADVKMVKMQSKSAQTYGKPRICATICLKWIHLSCRMSIQL